MFLKQFFGECTSCAQVRSLEEEIGKEKEEVNKNKASQEASVKKLKTELSGTKQKLQETEVSHVHGLCCILVPNFNIAPCNN